MPRLVPKPSTIKRSKKAQAERGATTRKYKNTGSMENAALVSPDKPLTTQQKEFAKFIAEGDSVPNALLRAGYSVKDNSLGYRMKVMPNVVAEIRRHRAEYAEASKMTKKKVIDMQLEAYAMAKLAGEPASMVSAAREIGRMCGFYEPTKVDVNVNVRQSIEMGRLSALSDADLIKFIEAGKAPILIEHTEDQEDGV